MKSSVVKRSIVISGHRKTSVSLEDEFWTFLKEIAQIRGQTVSDLVSEIEKDRGHANLSSAVRLFVLAYARDQTEVVQRGQTVRMHGPQAIEA